MDPRLEHALVALAAAAAGVLLVGLLLSALPRMGRPGRAAAEACARAPMLDVIVFALTAAPWVAGVAILGWIALPGVILGQLAGLYLWIGAHELLFRAKARGPRIVTAINQMAGRWRNHGALLATVIALPVFLLIRIAQVVAYPMLIWLVDFPRYRHREWINITRQKSDALVGHDLLWCLYCDWMTGVYALGAEMLRNVESFWCPIRFSSPEKCANCRTDFPDIEGGWTRPDAPMAEVVRVLEDQYGKGRREWFGHPARLTVNGAEVNPAPEQQTQTP